MYTDSYSGIEEMLRLGCEQTRTIHGAQMVRRPRTPLALAYRSDHAWAAAPSSLHHAPCPHGPACRDGGCPGRVYVPASCTLCLFFGGSVPATGGRSLAALCGSALKSYDSALLQAGLLLPCATANQSWIEPRSTGSWKLCPLHSECRD
jgi:hypothetical protein